MGRGGGSRAHERIAWQSSSLVAGGWWLVASGRQAAAEMGHEMAGGWWTSGRQRHRAG